MSANQIAGLFSEGLSSIETALATFPAELAETPWRPGGWTRKQVLGHMLDSAANNHQRFVRAALEGRYSGPSYQQDGWVKIHSYADLSWETLLAWWTAAHQMLEAVVTNIPEDWLNAACVVGEDSPVTLRFLIEDYLVHQQHHLAQITD